MRGKLGRANDCSRSMESSLQSSLTRDPDSTGRAPDRTGREGGVRAHPAERKTQLVFVTNENDGVIGNAPVAEAQPFLLGENITEEQAEQAEQAVQAVQNILEQVLGDGEVLGDATQVEVIRDAIDKAIEKADQTSGSGPTASLTSEAS